MSQDVTPKLQNIATKAMYEGTKLLDCINNLIELQSEYTTAGRSFQDSDFDSPLLKHLTPYMVGVLLGDTINAFKTTFDDAGHGNLNKNILLQIRG